MPRLQPSQKRFDSITSLLAIHIRRFPRFEFFFGSRFENLGNGRATIHGFSLGGCHRRARTPTLMLRPNGLAPARHHWFANVPPGVPFATPARESRRALHECHRANQPGHDVQRLSGAQVSAGNLVAARLDREAVSAASFRFSALHETVRPHSQDRQWADTPAISLRARLRCAPCCPCRTSPDASPDHRGVSINGRALPRRARRIPATRTKLWLCGWLA